MMADKYDAFLDAPDTPVAKTTDKYDAFLDAPVAQLVKQGTPGSSQEVPIKFRHSTNPRDYQQQENLAVLRDFLGGASSLMRGGANIVGSVFGNSKIGEKIWPTALANKDSMAYLAGQISDPAALALGGVATKAAGMVPVASKLAPVVHGAIGGGLAGAATGAITNEEDRLGGAGTGAVVGGAVGGVVPIAGKAIQKGVGWAYDVAKGRTGQVKAGQIARASAGGQLPAIRTALENADPRLTAAQAASDVPQDMWQSLGKVAQGADRNSYYSGIANIQNEANIESLARVAGGRTEAQSRAARELTKRNLNMVTDSMRDVELKAANTAGQLLPKLQGKADEMEGLAASAVDDVRRFVPATERSIALARSNLIKSNVPVGATKYTYLGGDLPEFARRVIDDSAATSLIAGDHKRFIQSQIDSLAAHGLKPLDVKSITGRLQSVLDDPTTGVSKLNRRVIGNVARQIEDWTERNGGVIDARALYEIRKSSVNDEIARLMPNADAASKSKAAAGILQSTRPAIDDAIEEAGGTGWRNYLQTYSNGMQDLNRNKLVSKALTMYQKNPSEFLRLVEGNNVKEVEKVFGAGSFDIVKEMGTRKMTPLNEVAGNVRRDIKMGESAEKGADALRSVIDELSITFRLPPMFRTEVSAMNKVLEVAEKNLSTKTKLALVEGMKSGKSAIELLNTLPTSEKNKLLMIMGQAGKISGSAGAISGAQAAGETP